MASKSRAGRGSFRRRVPALGIIDSGQEPALVVGLGNPGRRYKGSRHNAGFMAADRLMERGSLLARGKWPDGELALVEVASMRFLVLKPATYMNNSGRAVAPALKSYRLNPVRMVVIHDDIDIPLGEVRVKKGGGTAGHRGLVSIVEEIGEAGFTRVRIGVGRPPEGTEPADYVLTDFQDEELEVAGASVGRAAQAAVDLLSGVESGNG